jgi:predicted transcriptional regulator of viral defense system
MESIKHKTISRTASAVLAPFLDKGKAWFTFAEVRRLFPTVTPAAMRVQLKRMADNGLLLRIRPGVYFIIPFEREASSFLPDWHLLAAPLAAGSPHYIGYYSALQLHGLTTQPSLQEQIVVPVQIKKIILRGVTFQFITHNPRHFWGMKKEWADNFNQVFVSDLEKTFIDCLYHPNFAGGVSEIAKAIHAARNKINYEKLLSDILRFDAQVVVKRLGYLLELMQMGKSIVSTLQEHRSSSLAPLDFSIPSRGKIISRWNIRQNIEPETILSALET